MRRTKSLFKRAAYICLAMVAVLSVVLYLVYAPCTANNAERGVLYLGSGGKVKTLDPAQAQDTASCNMVGAFYDTLLSYDYEARPYTLQPSMLTQMPQSNEDMSSYLFTLRDDLFFVEDECFGSDGGSLAQRKVKSSDVVFSLLRIADSREFSPLFWLLRNKIKGIDEFRVLSEKFPKFDYSLYAGGIEGFEILDDRRFYIHLTESDPRFLYSLAIPYTGIMSEQAVKYYGSKIMEHPVGSGPFVLKEWIRDYRIKMQRNENYRTEYYKNADNKLDRQRKLPLASEIICYNIKQPLTAWLLFLQGELDITVLDKDNSDVVGKHGKLSDALKGRGIELISSVAFEIQYIGFNFTDPKLANNLNLRKAISLAYDIPGRIAYFNDQIRGAQGPLPLGVGGYDENFINPWVQYDLLAAKKYLALAGYPGGIDPATQEPLTLTFDINGNTSVQRQQGEMMVMDMERIGIKIIPVLNNGPRFFEKMRNGKFQLFRLSWQGDYPDGENFLQLFYSKNAGGSNRTYFKDERFDRDFEIIKTMPNSPERNERYREMAEYLCSQVPWIFESFPLINQLKHAWLENYRDHDFAFGRWKYLKVDDVKRRKLKSGFTPLSFSELGI